MATCFFCLPLLTWCIEEKLVLIRSYFPYHDYGLEVSISHMAVPILWARTLRCDCFCTNNGRSLKLLYLFICSLMQLSLNGMCDLQEEIHNSFEGCIRVTASAWQSTSELQGSPSLILGDSLVQAFSSQHHLGSHFKRSISSVWAVANHIIFIGCILFRA